MTSIAADLRFRGLVHQVTDQSLLERLDAGSMTLYAGFDPTAPSLHVGNLLQLCTLRRLQMGGHRPIFLAGGATGAIGDPGGRSEERPLQSADTLEENLEGLRLQLARFLELDDERRRGALLLDNRDWLGSVGLIEFLRDVGKHFTVNQMVARESVRARFERPDAGISFAEFSYMLLQAYDFLHLHDTLGCQLQVGGSDQWGNIATGVELVRKVRRRQVFGLTTPLVTKADGTKFGKTAEGTVWLDAGRTSPYRLYQFFVQTEDTAVGAHLRYFTFLPAPEIEELDAARRVRPQDRLSQRVLAREVTTLVHGGREAARAERASEALFDGSLSELDAQTFDDVVSDTPSTPVPRSGFTSGANGAGSRQGMRLVDALVASGLVSSKGEARRTLSQGGIYVNDRRQGDPDKILFEADLLHGRYLVLRRGRRRYHVLRAE